MNKEELIKRYKKIEEKTNKALIESRLKIKQAEKEMEDIRKKAIENIKKLSRLL